MADFEPSSDSAWWRTVCWINDDLLADPSMNADADVVASADRLLAAVRRATFGPDTSPEPEHPEIAGDTVRRAVSFMREHAARDITIRDIAAAVFLGPRALQLAFAKELGTTPTAYLRQLRLARAHQELCDRRGGRGEVGVVARRWRFGNSGRFAADYRAAYGCTPGATVRAASEHITPIAG